MNRLSLVVLLVVFGSIAKAQTTTVPPVIVNGAELLQAASKAPPMSGVWAGRLDLTSLPAIGAWQSLTSADQAIGVSKRLFHLDYSGQPLVNISVFAGATKPITDPATPVRFLAGDVIQVPGSTLDWALGTKWGNAWLPNLKTGVLFAHDLSRVSAAHLAPDFIGIGAAYPFGNSK